jgi:putative hemolysin
MVDNGNKRAKQVLDLVHRLDKVIATILICNNLVNTAIAAIGAVVFVQWFGEKWGLFFSTVAMTLLILIFGEITPKIYAAEHAEKISMLFVWPVKISIAVINPLANFLTSISTLLLRLVGRTKPKSRSLLVTEEEIKMLVKIGKETGLYEEEERRMLERIFHFDDITVSEVMKPLDQIIMVEKNTSQETLLETFLEKGHSRIPIYEGRKENIVGIFYVEGLLYQIQNPDLFQLEDLTFDPYFVDETMKINHLMREFQKRKVQIAIVQKEGKALGLVTLEDLIEEIVGEIEEKSPLS